MLGCECEFCHVKRAGVIGMAEQCSAECLCLHVSALMFLSFTTFIRVVATIAAQLRLQSLM